MIFSVLIAAACGVASLFAGTSDDVTLVFAGDAMQHERQLNAARRGDTYDYSACFRHVTDYVAAADYAVVNLECTLGGKPYTGYPCFSAPEEYALALKDAGFDLFLHANNHCLDRRDAGLSRTLDALDKMGMSHIGTYRNATERNNNYPLIVDVKGLKIGFLNYTYGTNGIEIRGAVVVDYINKDIIKADIANLRKNGAQMIVACMHWGVEYILTENSEQRSLAEILSSQGADPIIGGHPHVIQPMKVVTKANGKKALVVYSMGNFLSGMRTADTRGGAMVRVVIGRTNDGTPYLKDAFYNLVFVQDPENASDNYTLIPASKSHLVRPNQRAYYDKFTRNARTIFKKHNVDVNEDEWRWSPAMLFTPFDLLELAL